MSSKWQGVLDAFVQSPVPPEDVLIGRTRTVLLYSGFVVKIPTCEEGDLDGLTERCTYLRSDFPIAPIAGVDIDGVAVNIMERVDPVPNAFSDLTMPRWVSYVDCGQVGYRRNGELVAFDL